MDLDLEDAPQNFDEGVNPETIKPCLLDEKYNIKFIVLCNLFESMCKTNKKSKVAYIFC